MFRRHSNRDPTRLRDVLLDLGAAAYFLSFLAAVEIALGRLFY